MTARPPGAPLPRAFFARPTAEVARDLVGCLLVVRSDATTTLAQIVETEAYLDGRDAASHARFGPDGRSAGMFGPPGHLYVYLIYGQHHCLNVVTEPDGVAGAILIRSATTVGPGPHDPGVMSGPGRLTRALAIDRRHDRLDATATGAPVRFGPRPHDGGIVQVATSARIGVDYAGPWARRRLRFTFRGHPAVSGPDGARVRAALRRSRRSP